MVRSAWIFSAFAAVLTMVGACMERPDGNDSDSGPGPETVGETGAWTMDEPGDALGAEVRALIAESRLIAAALGDSVWRGLGDAPFQIVVTTEKHDVLICPEVQDASFAPLGEDPVTGCDVAVRDRELLYPALASFPAVGGLPTIVISPPEDVDLEPLSWKTTLLHEHFHQFQNSWPGYYSAANALDLAGDDESGMWMLNYPFPYEDEAVSDAINRMAELLTEALSSDDAQLESRARAYWTAREAARARVSDADWRYFEFQLWNEGVARWTEAAIAAEAGKTSPEFADHAEGLRAAVLNSLDAIRREGLGTWRRSAVYAFGAGEAEILERFRPGWRERYFTEPMQLASHFGFKTEESG